jgi:hypothetical protein
LWVVVSIVGTEEFVIIHRRSLSPIVYWLVVEVEKEVISIAG